MLRGAAIEAEVLGSDPLPERYFIKEGYTPRPDPEYADEAVHDGVVWQPDVYPEAARVAEVLGAACIVDVGCGTGEKVAALYPRFDVVGIDLPGPNLDACRARHPALTWIEHDVDSDLPLPVPEVVFEQSVVVCSDVIEHLRRPDHLLRALRSALDVAHAVVLSTPDRELTWGRDHNGPPPNPSHVREWSTAELSALLEHGGFRHWSMTLTRSNDQQSEKKTILCRLFDDAAALEAATSVEDASCGLPRDH